MVAESIRECFEVWLYVASGLHIVKGVLSAIFGVVFLSTGEYPEMAEYTPFKPILFTIWSFGVVWVSVGIVGVTVTVAWLPITSAVLLVLLFIMEVVICCVLGVYRLLATPFLAIPVIIGVITLVGYPIIFICMACTWRATRKGLDFRSSVDQMEIGNDPFKIFSLA